MAAVGDKVRHVDAPDTAENACVVTVKRGRTVTIVGPGAEGIGAEKITGVAVADLTRAYAPLTAAVRMATKEKR